MISYQHSDFFYIMSPKAHDWVQNLCIYQLFCWHQSQIKSKSTCLTFLLVKNNELSNVPLAFCQRIASVFYVALIMLLVFLAWWKVFGHISCRRHPSQVKTIQIIIFQACLHKLQAGNVEFLMPARWQYPRHRKLPVTRNLIDEGMTLRMLEALVKKLDKVAARWDPKPCRWLGQDCVCKF